LIILKKIFDTPFISNKILTSALSMFLIAFYLYQDLANWQLMKFIKAQGPISYVDSNTVLFYASCFSRIGNEVFDAGNYCAGWAYGSGILRFLNLIGVTQNNTILIGHIFTYLLVLTFVYYLYLARNFQFAQVVLFLGLISPSVWLLMERANFDALIYLMVFLSSILFLKNFEALSVFCLFLSATFKFYTLPLLIIPVILSKRIYIKLLGIGALFLGTIIIVSDFKLMTGKIVQAGNNHFGMKIIGNYLGKVDIKLNIFGAYFLGVFLFLGCILLFIFLLQKFEPILLQKQLLLEPVKSIYIFMSSTFLICFVVGLSVDYRLIFYLVSAPFLITLLKTGLRLIFSGFFLIGAWFCYPSGIFQTVGDLALELVAAFGIIILFLSLFAGKSDSKLNRIT